MAYQSKHTGTVIDSSVNINNTQNDRLTILENENALLKQELTNASLKIANLENNHHLNSFANFSEFGASNDMSLVEIINLLPNDSYAMQWINDNTYPSIFSELTNVNGTSAYGTISLLKHSQTTRVIWNDYHKNQSFFKNYTEINGVGWSDNWTSNSVIELLWANPNPSNNFSAQTITLKTNNYSHFIIISNESLMVIGTPGEKIKIQGVSASNGETGSVCIKQRYCELSQNSINFHNCYMAVGSLSSWTTDYQNNCKPYYIYGTNLFKAI